MQAQQQQPTQDINWRNSQVKEELGLMIDTDNQIMITSWEQIMRNSNRKRSFKIIDHVGDKH